MNAEPSVTPDMVDDLMHQIAFNTYRSHFDNELLDVDSELNMVACLEEFFDMDEGPEMYAFVDQIMDRIRAMDEVFK